MARKPVPVLRKELEASQLLHMGDHDTMLPIAVLEIPPLDQTHVSLGEYTIDRPPIGFAIEISPEHDPDDVVTQITRLEAAFDEYELTLHIANYRDNSITAEVFQLVGRDSEVTTDANRK